MQRMTLCFVLIVCTVVWSGCGRVFLGNTQTVDINVTPVDARIKIPDRVDGERSPFTIELPRNESHLVEISKEGYQTKWIVLQKVKLKSVIIADVLLTAGIGLFIDIFWGTWEGFDPSVISVTLEPVSNSGIPVDVSLQLTDSNLQVDAGGIEIRFRELSANDHEDGGALE